MGYSLAIKEEEIKNKVAEDYFPNFDHTKIVGNIDFCISQKSKPEISYIWAEAKKGNSHDIYDSFVQLILTIGKERTFEKHLPPIFLGAFDAERFAFLPYHAVLDIFNQSEINWNVQPSDHDTEEFVKIKERVLSLLEKSIILFNFGEDDTFIKEFIKENLIFSHGNTNKIEINKNNFTSIYYRWLATVKSSIGINWDKAKEKGIIDADFYLADLLSAENSTLQEKLFVVLNHDHYEFDRSIDEMLGTLKTTKASFNDGQKAHRQFWNLYDRPPKEEFWDFIIERHDLLVPQDVRERKGSYFTPQKWVELSQAAIADELGEDWQDEYYIWDCAAGTGNLLAGLTDKYKIWASTIDQSDVEIMKERIKNGANLLESHIFKFDFLNDDFSALPDSLKKIIFDEEKRKRLIIYINPPYAEAASTTTITSGENKNKTDVAVKNKVYRDYKKMIGIAGRELFIQFLTRIYDMIPDCKIAHFSTLKALQAPNFKKFRQFFRAGLRHLFITPANTFDNVSGDFPIGFFIWDTEEKQEFKKIIGNVYDAEAKNIGVKKFVNIDGRLSINDWLISTRKRDSSYILGYLACYGADFQHAKNTFIINSNKFLKSPRGTWITEQNLREAAIYYAVRKVIVPTWLNDRDQFLYPSSSWKEDKEFHNNCLIYTIFNTNIKSALGPNHWIPFKENAINAKETFESDFMYKYINGLIKNSNILGGEVFVPPSKLVFSQKALKVLDAAGNLYRYYNNVNDASNPNASIYDIKSFFQEKNNGRLKRSSSDSTYLHLISELQVKLHALSLDIIPKVYEYEFLLK